MENGLRMNHANQELYLIIDTIDASIFWKDLNGRYLGCNQYMVHMSGFKNKADVIGKKDCEMPWFKIADKLEAIDKSVLKTGIFVGEETPLIATSKKMVFHTKKTILYDQNKQIAGIIGISIDITERKKAENLLKKKQSQLLAEIKKAESANQAKTEFLNNMRHDIRTPLSGIVGFSEILKSETKELHIKEYADNLVASSHALLHLMDEVLEAVRVSSGEIPKFKRKFNLAETLKHVVALNKAKACEKRLDLSLSMDSNLPHFVIGDKIRIHRIVLELVSNALNFTDDGYVRIEVRLAKKKGRQLVIQLIVSDTGIGIPKDKQQEIYLQFKRLTPSYQGIYKGAGLGLYVVKQFIDELDGEIYVESAPRKGTVFTCIIPLQEPWLDDASGVDSAQNLKNEKPYMAAIMQDVSTRESSKSMPANKLLVVEDNFIAQTVAKTLLNNMDCEVDIAANGVDALLLYEKNHYDLIFMDIGLGEGMDGYAVAHHIRNHETSTQHIPIIALTAHANDESKQRCIEAGMDAVLTKPLTQTHAADILKTFVPSRHELAAKTCTNLRRDLPDKNEEMFQLNQFVILDIDEALKNCSSKDILIELLKIMIEELPVDLEAMKSAYSVGDYSLVEKIAHKIKGGAMYVGATRVKYACQYVERYWKSQERVLFDSLYHQAVNTIEETCIFIHGWLENQVS